MAEKIDEILDDIRTLLEGEAVVTTFVTAQPLVSQTQTLTLPGVGGTYAAQDEVSDHATGGSATPLHWTDLVAANGDTGYIVKATIEASTAVVANAVFRLWLFNAAPTMYGNDSPYQLDAADQAKRVGYIDFALVTEGTGSDAAYGLDDGLRLAFKTATADRDLFGILVAKAGYVWAAAQTFNVTLTIETA
jgi:hypothetical protein